MLDVEKPLPGKPKVIIVDDHVGVAESLATALRDQTREISTVSSLPVLRAALRRAGAKGGPVDIVFLDLAVGSDNALEWLPDLVEDYPEVRFIVLTGYSEFALMEASLSAGARGFLVKSASIAEIQTAMATVASGKTYRSPGVHRIAPSRAPASPTQLPGADRLVRPTNRQREILLLLRDGATMAAAAEALDLHERTIEYHLRTLRQKLGGVTLLALMRWFEDYLNAEAG
ncbi:MAG: response regulator transcription factor [Gemmatimonadales bacterium]